MIPWNPLFDIWKLQLVILTGKFSNLGLKLKHWRDQKYLGRLSSFHKRVYQNSSAWKNLVNATMIARRGFLSLFAVLNSDQTGKLVIWIIKQFKFCGLWSGQMANILDSFIYQMEQKAINYEGAEERCWHKWWDPHMRHEEFWDSKTRWNIWKLYGKLAVETE